MMKHSIPYISAWSGLLLALTLLVACAAPGPVETPPTVTALPALTTVAPTPAGGLSAEASATLTSLQQVDDYPLYTMQYAGAYPAGAGAPLSQPTGAAAHPGWGCTLFTALYDPQRLLYGRNFDWEFSPALLLFTDPPDGYASVSMVDIVYLGFSGEAARDLTSLPLTELRPLLDAPSLPFDGMNEVGLVVGMAAVPNEEQPYDPAKETIGSLGVIREMLDHARTVEEAVALLGSYTIDMAGGPMLHYLIADASGQAALVEFYRGEMVVIPNQAPWHLATNFLVTAAQDDPTGRCWRYDTIEQGLSQAGGQINEPQALDLLAAVAQESTQWSVVYNLSSHEVRVVMGQQYQTVHLFQLNPGE